MPSPLAASSTSVTAGVVDRGEFEICKNYVGAVGPAATFRVQVDEGFDGDIDSDTNVQVANGQCLVVWTDTQLGADQVTVTEQVPTGFTASYVRTEITGGGSINTFPSVASNTVTDSVGDRGVLVVFTNTGEPPPPPPGGQGCTPGYWKQDHHFDSWPAAYSPNQLFSSVFENAFPGMTLVQVLGQGGGGLNALGRHTVAALLNAAKTQVGSPYTPAQVIAKFNAVFPGGNYSGLHNEFAALNERTCPLN